MVSMNKYLLGMYMCFQDTFTLTILCSTEIVFFKEGFSSVITMSP